MSHPRLVRRRLAQRLLPVLLFSLAFNLTKFFEADITYVPIEVSSTTEASSSSSTHVNTTSYLPVLSVTAFRTNPAYQTYLSWSRYSTAGIGIEWA